LIQSGTEVRSILINSKLFR